MTSDASITQTVIPTCDLEEWLRQIESAIKPSVPFDHDQSKMMATAYEYRGGVLQILANQIRARGVHLR